MDEPLTEPPAEEGDNQFASEGTDDASITDVDLEDAVDLEDDDDDE